MTATIRDRLPVRGYAGRLFLTMSMGWFGAQIGRAIIPPLLPRIIQDFGITPFLAGSGLTVFGAMYALSNYPGGRLSDQLSRKTVLVGGLFLLSAGFFLLGIAVTYRRFIAALAIAGIGLGLLFISMRTITADLYLEHRAKAFGTQTALGNIGSASAGVLAIIVIGVMDWRAAFIPIALFLLVVTGLVHLWLREPYVVEFVKPELFQTGLRMAKIKPIRRVVITYILLSLAWNGVIGFLPTFLEVEKGFSVTLASAAFSSIFLVGIVVGPIGGTLGDRYAKRVVATVALSLLITGLSLIILLHSGVFVVASVLVFAVGFWLFPPVMQAYMIEIIPADSVGGDFGAIKTVYTGVGSLGASYVGLAAEHWSYSAGFGGLVICLLLGILILGRDLQT